jgi:hypothetical protein
MEREFISNYSINSSGSRISIMDVNNFIQDSNISEMLENIRQSHRFIQPDNTDENDNCPDNIINQSQESSVNTINSNELFGDMSLLTNNQNEQSILENEDQFFEAPDYLLLNHGRAATAPAKPANEFEEFKYSPPYLALEKAVLYSEKLVMLKTDAKFDVDSEEGSEICKKFLDQLEKIIKVGNT